MLNHVDVDIDKIDLERILNKQISDTEPGAFTQAFDLLSGRINFSIIDRVLGTPVKTAFPFNRAKYKHAMKLLDEIAGYTISGSTPTGTGPTTTSGAATAPTSVPTQHAIEAMILRDYVKARWDVRDKKLESARTNLANATATLDKYVPGHKKLRTLLQFNDALITMKTGDFNNAYQILQGDNLATNVEASYVRGIIKVRQGQWNDAEKDLRTSYKENPHREAVRQGLAKVYDNLAFTVTAEPTEIYTPIPQSIRTKWEEAIKEFSEVESRGRYTGNDFDAVKTKFEEIDSGTLHTRNAAGKAMKARAKHYLANIEIAKGNLIAADKLLQESIAIVPSSKAYECLTYVFNNMKTA